MLVCVLTLAGCATRPPLGEPAPAAVWEAHRRSVQQLVRWKAQGRLAIRNQDDGWQAEFDWLQDGDNYQIRLRGPFGQGAMELTGDAHGVLMRRKDEATVFAANADVLLEAETGWAFPVAGLHDWLRGLPVEHLPAELVWDGQGQLSGLQQDGWDIEYSRYGSVNSTAVPVRMQLVREAIRVKVVVDNWQVL